MVVNAQVALEPHNLQRLTGFLELNRGWTRQGLQQLSWCAFIAKLCPDCFQAEVSALLGIEKQLHVEEVR